MKFLMWIALLWIAVLWLLHLKKLRAAGQSARMARAASAGPRAAAPGAAPEPENMLPCAHCGVHLPRSEAIASLDGKLVWCSEEHRRQAPR